MSFVRNLISDIVDKRLWPVAVALGAALVVALVVLRPGAAPEQTASSSAPVVPAAPPVESRTAVKLETAPPTLGRRRGRVRNPFRQAAAPAPAATTSQTSPSTGTATASPAPATTASGGGAPPPSTSATTTTITRTTSAPATAGTVTTTKPAAPATDALDTYRVGLRVAVTTKPLKSIHDLPRLSPLPSANDPFFVYMGVLKDGKTASFLLSSDATATGDGKCLPTHTSCQTIELEEGDTVFFDVNGSDVQYQMDLVHITKHSGGAVTAAAASLERHSTFGAALLRHAHEHGDDAYAAGSMYRFLPETGLVTRLKRSVLARASDAGTQGSAPAAEIGEPVWHWRLGD